MKRAPVKSNRTDIKNMLRIRLTPAERRLLDEFAESKGAGTSTWARMELLRLAAEKR